MTTVTNKHKGKEVFVGSLVIPAYDATADLPDPTFGRIAFDNEANSLVIGDGSAWIGATTATPNVAAITDGPGAPTTAANSLKLVRQNAANTALEYVFMGQMAVSNKTDDYTTVLADAGTIITMNNTAAKTLTIPANDTVAYPVGTVIGVAALDDQQSIAVTSDTVLIDAAKTQEVTKNGIAWARKIAATTWLLYGDLVAA